MKILKLLLKKFGEFMCIAQPEGTQTRGYNVSGDAWDAFLMAGRRLSNFTKETGPDSRASENALPKERIYFSDKAKVDKLHSYLAGVISDAFEAKSAFDRSRVLYTHAEAIVELTKDWEG
jgi:hypothetical protein